MDGGDEDDDLLLALVAQRRHRHAALVDLARLMNQPERPLVPDVRFRLGDTADANCLLDFRFDKKGIRDLYVTLFLPDVVITPQRDRRLVAYCDAVAGKGAPLDVIYGFIDGTKIATSRPGPTATGLDLQRVVYTGHKRMHCLSYQAVTAPDGLCIHFWCPMEGRRHDAAMLRESRLVNFLDQQGDTFTDRFIYGDPAYGVSHRILSGFKGNLPSTDMKEFNRRMSSVRESVEWSFALLKNLWKFIDYKKQQRILHSPVAQVVAVAMLLTNCRTCYNRGNQISMYFGLTPPTLVDYLTSETARP